ncbi:MAG: hypothetical protein ABEJ46_05235, partial [Gemmatimonadota bacterium]
TGDRTMLERFRAWMRTAEQELLVTFVLLILFSLLITTLLVAATVGTNNPGLAGDLTGMVTEEARILEEVAGTWLKVVFLLGGSFVLFSTCWWPPPWRSSPSRGPAASRWSRCSPTSWC